MDDFSLSLLQMFKDRGRLNLIDLGAILNASPLLLVDPVKVLLAENYLKTDFSGEELSLNTKLEISGKGICALADSKNQKRYFRFSEFRDWATLIIAMATLVLTVITVIKA